MTSPRPSRAVTSSKYMLASGSSARTRRHTSGPSISGIINSLPVGAVAPLLLGRIATLPVAILFGPWYGGLSAVVGAVGVRGSLSVLSIVILIIEALIIGAVAHRGKPPLVAGALLWGAAAIMLVIALQWYGVEYLRRSIWPIALQVVLNGLVAIVVADLIATAVSMKHLVRAQPVEQRRIRSYAFHAFVLVGTLPVLLLAAVDSQLTATRQESSGGARLKEAVTALREHIDDYLGNHLHAVEALTAAAGGVRRHPRPSVVGADRHDRRAARRLRRRGRGGRRRIAGPLEVRTLRRGFPHPPERADHDRRSARSRHLRRRTDRLHGARKPGQRRSRAWKRRRRGRDVPLSAAGRTPVAGRPARGDGLDSAGGMESVRRAAAAESSSAVDRVLCGDARIDLHGARRRGAGRARVRRRRHAPARRAGRHRSQHLRARRSCGGASHLHATGRNRRAARGRQRHADAAGRFIPAARTGARAARTAEHQAPGA